MKKLLAALYLLLTLNVISAQLVTYKAPEGSNLNNDFTVKVRQKGKDWQPVSVYLVKVAKVNLGQRSIENSSLAYFDFAGAVEVAITYNKGTIDSSRIRPGPIYNKMIDNTIFFTLTNAKNLSIEVNGDIFHNLQLFANPLETNPPLPSDKNVLYFGAGIHNIDSVNVKSNQTIYIAGGAVVRGSFRIINAENVKLWGHGIIDNSAKGITIDHSKNAVIEGVIMLNPKHYTVTIGESDSVAIRNIKSFSCEGNGDGIDVFCSSHILIDGVYMRNSDDCIAIYAHRWNWYGNTLNIQVQDATLWADIAHPILMGTHGDPLHPDTLGNMVFKNIDILDQHEDQIDYQGCMALNAGDGNLISNIRFEDIRIGDIRKGQVVNMRVMFNHKYNTAAGGGIENVYFKNISYTGTNANMSVITGYDEMRTIRNVVFEDLMMNGKLIWDRTPDKPAWFKTGDLANIFIGEHVNNITFVTKKLQ